MSTLASATLASSDEEGDADFVPSSRPAKKRKLTKGKGKAKPKTGSGSGSESASSGSSSDDDGEGLHVEDAEAEKLREEAIAVQTELRRRKAAEAVAGFKTWGLMTVDTPGLRKISEEDKEKHKKVMQYIMVPRKRKFAGEVVEESILLPANHPDAIAHLASKGAQSSREEDRTDAEPEAYPGAPNLPTTASGTSGQDGSVVPSSSKSIPAPAVAAKPAAKGPPKRKPRQSLEQLSAGLAGGKKMTTLEKSQMDWKSHVASSSNVSDELASNRRSGGFLEKRDFLDRVGDRRNETLDQKRKTGR